MTTTTSDLPGATAVKQNQRDGKRVLVKIVWTLAMLMIAGVTINGYIDIQLASSAPQQAAAAGMNCFYAITPYMFARAVDAMLR